MNGLERITGRIKEEAKADVDRILSDGRAEANRVADAWRARIDAERRTLAEQNERAAAAHEQRLKSAAEMEARKAILQARQELMDAAYALALEKLCSLRGEPKVALLIALLARASSNGAEEAIFSAADRAEGEQAVARVNAEYGKNLTVSSDNAPIHGGFILRGKRVEVNCAFETLLRLQRTETGSAVAKLLFP